MSEAEVVKLAPTIRPTGMNEIGVSGLKVWSGFINEETMLQLKGQRGIKNYKQMANDSTVKAMLRAVTLVLQGAKWRFEAADDSEEAKAEKEFAESLFQDMSHTWEDFLSEALTMLQFGWAWHEVVIKRRIGPLETDPAKRSKFNDGRIGIRKLAPRGQDTLYKWEFDEDGGVSGMWQQPETGGTYYLPIERSLLFRTVSVKNNPEGESILRSAYESWYHARNIRNYESVGIERELAGLPVVKIPAKYFSATATPAEVAMRERYVQIARDLKFNEQGGLVIPSDPYYDGEGKPTNIKMVEVELLSTGGTRAIDTDKVIQRHQRDIVRSVLADFIMLGSDSKGSYALSKDKTDLFLMACKWLLIQIAAPINRFLLPRIWDYNGLDRALMPQIKPGDLAAVDLSMLGSYLQALSSSGAPLFPDQALEEHLREVADLPPPSEEAQALSLEQQKAEAKARFAPPDAGPGGAQDPNVKKFNPNHAPAGDEHGGEFTSGSTSATPAQDLYNANKSDNATIEDLNAAVNKQDPNFFADAKQILSEIAQQRTTKDEYSRNGIYTDARSELHMKILEDLFANVAHAVPAPGEAPTLTLSGGRTAAGKTTALGSELQHAVNNAIYINADEIQEKLPGYQGKYAALYNGEAQDIALQAESIARLNGLNIVYDATMKSSKPAMERVKLYKANGYKVTGYFVHTTPLTSALRSVGRFRGKSGRFVPLEVGFNSRTNEKTFDSLIPYMDKWSLYDNNGTKPRKVASGGA